MILKGLGELHIEIVLQRLLKQNKLKIKSGKRQVAFKEILVSGNRSDIVVDKKVGSGLKYLSLDVETVPINYDNDQSMCDPEVEFDLWKNAKTK